MTKMDKLNQEYKDLHENEVILDVRGADEYRDGHVPGSINIPHTEVANHIDELKEYKLVHIHCKMGGRAKMAYDSLTKNGLTNLHCIDDSGMEHWKKQGYEVNS